MKVGRLRGLACGFCIERVLALRHLRFGSVLAVCSSGYALSKSTTASLHAVSRGLQAFSDAVEHDDGGGRFGAIVEDGAKA